MWRGYVAGALLTATLACSGKSESAAPVDPDQTPGGGHPAGGGAGAGGAATGSLGGQSNLAGDRSAAGATSAWVAGAAASDSEGGAGGAGSVSTQVRCSDLAGFPDLPSTPFERVTVTGSNGTFVDECDADGNVVEYHCPMQQLCGGGTDCAPYPTGAAAPRTVACESGCADGVCLK